MPSGSGNFLDLLQDRLEDGIAVGSEVQAAFERWDANVERRPRRRDGRAVHHSGDVAHDHERFVALLMEATTQFPQITRLTQRLPDGPQIDWSAGLLRLRC